MPNAKKKQKQKKNGRQMKALETTRRIEASLSAANALVNPTEGLETFMNIGMKAKAESPTLVIADTGISSVTVQYYPSPLPDDLHKGCLGLFNENMSDMYKASSWGLDLEEKSDEFLHENARFLIVTDGGNNEGVRGDLLAYAHFRFDVNDSDLPTEEVLYVYELQVNSKRQQCGLGRRLMAIMELVAMRAKMRRVMLTVFESNQAALGFYLNKMKYIVDESSPSQYEGEDAEYEILSKVVWKGEE